MRGMHALQVLGAGLAVVCLTMAGTAADSGPVRLDDRYGQLELSFEANWGQADPAVQFLARGAGYGLLLTPTEAILSLSRAARSENPEERRDRRRSHGESALVRVRLAGANAAATILGEGLLPGKANYFSGRDPAGWITGVPTYRKIRVEGVYPGVDLVYYGNQRELEFDFVVAPGADPDSIRLAYDGVEDIRLDPGGDLVLRTRLGEVRQHSPSVYQEEGGQLKKVSAVHVLRGGREVGFEVRDYDRARPLVIDPRLSYSTLLGGGNGEVAAAIALDAAGSVYVTGSTVSTNFPVSAPYQGTASGNAVDGFVAKLNPTGSALEYSTYLRGNDGAVESMAIAVDDAGCAYVGGFTNSHSFPTTAGAFQTAANETAWDDAFITKLSPTGSQLVFSTYVSGPQNDVVLAVAVNPARAVFAGGFTASGVSFPTKPGAFQTTGGGGLDAFVLQLDPAGARLVSSTLLGGAGQDQVYGIAVDSSGNAYVAGLTESSDFPTTPGAYQTPPGQMDAFLTKVNSTGSALVYSSRFGGGGVDAALGLAIDALGSAYAVGYSASTNFPVTAGAFQRTNKGGEDAFALKLNPAGAALVYSTLLGGAGPDRAWGVAVDPVGNAHFVGDTDSSSFPVSADAIRHSRSGERDAFVVKVSPTGSALPFSTYLGGTGVDTAYSIALDSRGSVYVAGATDSANFPVSPGAFQTTRRGVADAFIAKLEIAEPAALALSIVSGNNQMGRVGTALPAPLIVALTYGGEPVAGATVTFSSTGATLAQASVQTGADGRASTLVTPAASGTVTINAATPGAAAVVFTATVQPAPAAVTFTSAASFRGGAMAPGMISVAWGQGFTNGLFTATSLPLPTTLGGVSVTLRDSAGIERPQSLFFANATQVNFYLDDATQGSPATVRITGQDGKVQTADLTIENVNPGLFSLNSDGQGIVAGNVIRVGAGGAQTVVDIMRYDSALRKWVGNPIDFGGITDRIFLVLYGTGFRHRSGLASVNATVGGIAVKVDYLGAQGSMVGLDQFNFELPRATAGRGEVPIVLTVDGKTANTVTVTVGP